MEVESDYIDLTRFSTLMRNISAYPSLTDRVVSEGMGCRQDKGILDTVGLFRLHTLHLVVVPLNTPNEIIATR